MLNYPHLRFAKRWGFSAIHLINYKIGDLLNASEDIIGHQVNCQGVMGAGLAKQIKHKHPLVYRNYKNACTLYHPSEPLGKIQLIHSNKKNIYNIFSQNNYGVSCVQTDYAALRKSLVKLKKYAKRNYLDIALAKGIRVSRRRLEHNS